MAKYLEISIFNRPLNQKFTYLNLEEYLDKNLVGYRAEVNLGNQKVRGFIVGESDELENPGFDIKKLRKIRKVIDKGPVFTEETIEMARWVAEFYVCTEGEAISVMMPNGLKDETRGTLGFSEEADFERRTLSE